MGLIQSGFPMIVVYKANSMISGKKPTAVLLCTLDLQYIDRHARTHAFFRSY